ncbi:DNA topoisomerase 2-alpha [Oryzias melastigma]|uniref:DNA topoisomerase 2-alpha n=1 Tax=Oryzias melastigma TaxID=30732 RepID=A0A834FG50_ORYME|nr:DNA topoisomerase 2-alpha [Oryzias melastigma]
MLNGEEPLPMLPNYKGFRGTIEHVMNNQYMISGEVAIIDSTTIEISELPVKTWTQAYKENVLEPMLNGTDKVPALITDYKDYHTDTTVRFVVKMTEEKLMEARLPACTKSSSCRAPPCNSMVLFDHTGSLKKYESVQGILKEFFELRMKYYVLRKEWLTGMLGAESSKLSNQARFILEKIQGTLVIENKPKKVLIKMLPADGLRLRPPSKRGRRRRRRQDAAHRLLIRTDEEEVEAEEQQEEEEKEDQSSGPDYNYLLSMPMWFLTKEKKEELCKQRDAKMTELNTLKERIHRICGGKTWLRSLKNWRGEVGGEDGVRMKIRENLEQSSKPVWLHDWTRKQKTQTKKALSSKGKQTTLQFSSVSKKPKKNPWSDEESGAESEDEPAVPRERVAGQPKSLNHFLRFPFLAPVTYTLSDSEDEFDDVGKKRTSKRKAVVSDDDISFAVETGVVSDSDAASPAPAPKAPAAKKVTKKKTVEEPKVSSSSPSDDPAPSKAAAASKTKATAAKKAAPSKKPAASKKKAADTKQPSILDVLSKPKAAAKKVTALISSDSENEAKAAKKKPKPVLKRKQSSSDDDSDSDSGDLMARLKSRASVGTKKTKKWSEDESLHVSEQEEVAPRDKAPRARKPFTFKLDSESDEDF